MMEIHNINGAERIHKVWYVTDDYGMVWRFFEVKGVRGYWTADLETDVIRILGDTCWSKYVDKSIPKRGFVRYA